MYDMDRVLRKAGAERVCEKASTKLGEIIEDSARELLLRARVYARHAGRNYMTKEDIHLAAPSLHRA
jgi:histone H3/H4